MRQNRVVFRSQDSENAYARAEARIRRMLESSRLRGEARQLLEQFSNRNLADLRSDLADLEQIYYDQTEQIRRGR